MIWADSVWNTLHVSDWEEFRKRVERSTGLKVIGRCHGNKPEFDPEASVDWELVQQIAAGHEVSASSTSSAPKAKVKAAPVHKKATPRKKKPKGGK